jgi:anti-anti-sigma factor
MPIWHRIDGHAVRRFEAMDRILRIDAQPADDTLTLFLRGELDLATLPEVRSAFARHADGQVAIVVDLHDLDFIDSSGLRVLLELNATQLGPPVRFQRPSEPVSRLLDLTGIGDLLTWRDDAR